MNNNRTPRAWYVDDFDRIIPHGDAGADDVTVYALDGDTYCGTFNVNGHSVTDSTVSSVTVHNDEGVWIIHANDIDLIRINTTTEQES